MVSFLEVIESMLAAAGIALLVIYFLERQKTKRYAALVHASSSIAARDAAAQEETDANDDSPRMCIIFCSQSGTGQGFAEGLADEAKTYGYKASVYDIEEYDYQEKLQEEKLVIWYVATHGEGDPTDSCLDFDEWIMSEDREVMGEDFSNHVFAVFALGNRQYEFFNAMGIKYDKRFAALNGTRLFDIGLGDDDGSIEEDSENWRVALWPKIHEFFNVKQDESLALTVPVHTPSYRIVYDNIDEEKGEETLADKFARLAHVHSAKHVMAPVVDIHELRAKPTEGLSTKHLALDLSGIDLPYKTAANLGVRAHNPYKTVAKICQRLGIDDADRLFTLKPLRSDERKKLSIPLPCTARDALLWYLDICNVPRKRMLGFLSQYATDEEEKAKLASMALPTGKELYHKHYVEEKTSLLETLEMFPSVRPPFEHFVEECPALQSRAFTISSSAMCHPEQVHITVALVRDELPNSRTHEGVCSTYLCNLREGREVCVNVRDSSFFLPSDPSTPVIMIGPGTGIAPFRGFIQEAKFRPSSTA